MNIQLAERMNLFSSSIFSELAAYKQELKTEGKIITDFTIGSPDLPPPSFVQEIISQRALDNLQYGYSLSGTEMFHKAVKNYYNRKYDVSLQLENEILQLMGSQDALVHLPMVLANPGDIVLVPDPGYTAYATGIAMAGAVPFYMPLTKENGYLPDFTNIPSSIAEKAKIMILNFPGNPIPVMATKEFFKEAIEFAQKYNIIIIHDFAYSELYYSEETPVSFLSVPGSKDVGIEVNSLSKSFNMAGCRVAYAIGNSSIINALKQLKSNLDYGVFYPIQHAAAQALTNGDQFTDNLRLTYKKRRDCLVDGLNNIGWFIEKPESTMFIWAPIPINMKSKEFAFLLMQKAGVAVTPGIAFGPSGENFVRIALVQEKYIIQKAIENLRASKILQAPY